MSGRYNTRLSTSGSSLATGWRGIGIFPGLPRLEAAFLATELAIFLIGFCFFIHFSRAISQFTDARLLEGGGMGGPAIILASPAQVWVGEETTTAAVAARLRNALYAEGETGSAVGTFKLVAGGLQIRPGPASFFRHAQTQERPAELKFRDGRITAIKSLPDNTTLQLLARTRSPYHSRRLCPLRAAPGALPGGAAGAPGRRHRYRRPSVFLAPWSECLQHPSSSHCRPARPLTTARGEHLNHAVGAKPVPHSSPHHSS